MTQYTGQNNQRHQNNQSNQQDPNYYNRYRRGSAVWWRSIADGLMDAGPAILGLSGWVIALGCLLALESMDIVIGHITAQYMFNGKYDWLFSAGTTGLAIAVLGTAFYGWRERWSWWILVPIVALAMIPVSIDVLNDAMSVDILAFGHFINTNVQFAGDPVGGLMHNLYRVMLGSMSALGEPIAAASVVIFPLMKDILRSSMR